MPAQAKIIFNGEDQSKDAADSAKQNIQGVAEAADSGGAGLAVFFGTLAAGLAEAAASEAWDTIKAGLDEIVAGGIASNTTFETFTQKFDVLLGSADAAKQKMDELQQVGFVNPQQLTDIDQMDIKLVNVGLDSEDTAKRVGLSGATIRQDILNTSAGVATGAGDMGEKLSRVTFDVTTFFQTASARSITDLMRMGAVTREQLEQAGMHWDAHNHIVGDKVENTKILLEALGDKYKDLNVKSMTTLAGMESNWEDLKGYIERTITGSLFDSFKSGLSDVLAVLGSTEAKQAYQDMSDGIGEIMEAFGKLFGSVGDNKDMILTVLDGIAKGITFIGDAALYVADSWGQVQANFFTPIENLVTDAEVWGNNIIVSFATGMTEGFSAVVGVIQDVGNYITDQLESHSPPKLLKDLTVWGKGAIDSYFDGWKQGDYSAFDTIKSQVSTLIASITPKGAGDKSAITAIMGTDEAVAKAIGEFERTGQIAASTYADIKEKAGAAGDKVAAFVSATVDEFKAEKDVTAAAQEVTDAQKAQADAQQEVADAQQKINDLNKDYSDQNNALNDQLKGIADAQKALADAANAALQPMRDQVQAISDQIAGMDAKRRMQDLADQAAGTGSHANDAEHAELAVQLDQNRAKEDEIRHTEEVNRLHEEINKAKAAGKDTTDLELQLQEKELSYQDQKMALAEKTRQDQEKQAAVGQNGEARQRAALELKKAQTEADIHAGEEAAKKAQEPLTHQAEGIKKQQEDLKTKHEADLKGAQAVLATAQEHKKEADDHLKLAEAHKKLADEHLKTAQDHLKVMQDQTKEISDQLKLKQQIEAIDDKAAKQAGAHHGGGGPHGGGGGKKEPPPPPPPPPPGPKDPGLGSDDPREHNAGYNAEQQHKEDMSKPFEDFKKTLDGFKQSVVGALSPVNDLFSAITKMTGPLPSLNDVTKEAASAWDDFHKKIQPAINVITLVGQGIGGGLTRSLSGLLPHLSKIKDEFGQLGDKVLPPLSKAWDKIQKALTDLEPIFLVIAGIIGTAMVTAIGVLVGIVNGLAQAFEKALPDIETLVGDFATYVGDLITLVSDTITGLGEIISTFCNDGWAAGWQKMKDVAFKLLGDVCNIVLDMMRIAKDYIMINFDLITGFLSGFIDGFVNFFKGLYDTMVGHSIIPDLVNAVKTWFTTMVTDVTKAIEGFITDITTKFNTIKDNLVNAVTNGVTDATKAVVGFTVDILLKIDGFKDDVFKKATDVGTNLVNGIKAGLDGAWGELTSELSKLAGALPGPVQKALGINSPSTVFKEEVGQWIPKGLAEGIRDSAPHAVTALTDMTAQLIPSRGAMPGGQDFFALGTQTGQALLNSGAASRPQPAPPPVITINLTVNVNGADATGSPVAQGILAAARPAIASLQNALIQQVGSR